MQIQVLIVDDHQLMREGLRNILERHSGLEVVGETDNGRTALEMAKTLAPKVVLMDLSMPEMNGIEAIRQLSAELPEVRSIALSMHSSRRFVTEALTAGAKGYVLKDAAGTDLVEAITAAAEERVFFSPQVNEVIVEDYQRRVSASALASEKAGISSRERQVVQLIAEGKNTKEIAYLLEVSTKTVEAHRAQVMKKLNLRSVADIVKYAIVEGITLLQ